MDEKTPKVTYIKDLPHYDSDDHTCDPIWHEGLTYVVGAVIKADSEESQPVVEKELGE